MSANGRRRPPRPRIELVTPAASEQEAAAIVAAVEQFLADSAPVATATPGSATGPWQRAALLEGISARQLAAGGWGHAPARWADSG